MSEKIDIIIDSSTDVEAGNEIVSTSTDNNIDIEILEPEYDITINKREYVITGDNLYIPKTYDESPQWIKDIIGTITDFSLNQKLTEIGALSNTLYALIDELEVAKNTYTNSIITSAEIDERINARIETLNSSIAESDATIVDLITTKATPTEASSLALNVLTASINDGAISSLVSNLQSAISTTNSTLSNNIDIVHAEMTGEFNANAEVIDSMQAYVGIDEAGASTGTGVSAYLEGSNGVIGSADSKVANNVYVDGNGISRSKFEYNSTVSVGGVNYSSGFGLSNSSGTGVGSEFWINADKFKFTNNGKTGTKVPFSIDASGVTPQVYFNGRVQFSNVDGYTPPDVSGDISSNNDIFAQKLGYLSYSALESAATAGQTVVVGGKINTELIEVNAINANQINTTGLIAEDISANEIVGKTITGGNIVGTNIVGVTIRASYLDLDGELEILTNFYLCVDGNTTGVPALAISEGRYRTYTIADIDAIPSTAYNNLYRIPSISTVREDTKVQTLNSTGASLISKIRSYNCANAGHNVKCVKVRPNAFVSGFNIVLDLTLGGDGDGYRNSSTAKMYFGGVLLGSVYFRAYYYSWITGGDQVDYGVSGSIQVYLDGNVIYSYTDSDTASYNNPASISSPSLNTTRTVNGVVIRISCGSWNSLSFSIDNGEYELPANFNNISESLFRVENANDTAYSSIRAYTNSATYINNMI